ncbi:hypothetical protein DVK06_00290 [Halorubrum sp. Atlit-28R]|nr:hypothetical protein DVK06_00290 [Halorubrum sp. Atlit-28R]
MRCSSISKCCQAVLQRRLFEFYLFGLYLWFQSPFVSSTCLHPRNFPKSGYWNVTVVAVEAPLAESLAVVARDDDRLCVKVLQERHDPVIEYPAEIVSVSVPRLFSIHFSHLEEIPHRLFCFAALVRIRTIAHVERSVGNMWLHIVDDQSVEVAFTADRNSPVCDSFRGDDAKIVVPAVTPYLVKQPESFGIGFKRVAELL